MSSRYVKALNFRYGVSVMTDDAISFDKLETKDLVKMLKNVKLGKDYLLKFLDKDQFNELLDLGELRKIEKINVQSDAQEKVGNVALVLNTILTSSLGAWLGFAGFSGLHLNSFFTFVIIGMAILIGGTVGRLSYQLTHKQAIASITDMKLFNIQTEIIKTILRRRTVVLENYIYKVMKRINFIASEKLVAHENSIEYLEGFLIKAISDARFQEDLNDLINGIENPQHRLFYERMAYILVSKIQKISKLLVSHQRATKEKVLYTNTDKFNQSDLLMNTSLTNASYIRVLTKTDLPSKRLVPRAHRWIRNNFLGIIVGLLPTIMGGFASMFVFLDGIPDILKAFGLFSTEFATHALGIKLVSITCALCITSYLGYSNLHTNYKAFRRTKQLEHAETKVAETEEEMMHQVILLNLLIRLNSLMKQLKLIFQSLKIIDTTAEQGKENEQAQ
jgi:hypothetical protein